MAPVSARWRTPVAIPNSKRTAITAIERIAAQIGLTAEDVLDAADGLLSGRLSPAGWRAQLGGEPAAESVENHAEEGEPRIGPDRR